MNGKIIKIAEGKNFTAVNIGKMDSLSEHVSGGGRGKVFLKEEIKASGAEVSFALLPAGEKLPFSHSHKQNEEVYIIIKGKGEMDIDGEIFPLSEGSVIRVSPAGKRVLQSAADEDLIYITIQVKEKSLEQWTMNDGVLG